MSPSRDRIRVVCVDDEPQLASLVCTYLEREVSVIDATACRTAAEALDRIDEEAVDCVVSDYDLEHTDGIEFLQDVREEHGDLPFVLFTARGNEAVASEAISEGVTEYMRKGRGVDRYRVLANRVVSVVEKRRAEAQLARAHRQRHDLLEVAPAPVNVYDETGTIVFSNPASAELLGAESPADVVGRSSRSFTRRTVRRPKSGSTGCSTWTARRAGRDSRSGRSTARPRT